MRTKAPRKAVDVCNDNYSDEKKMGFVKQDDGFVGTATAVSLSKSLHIVLIAPTAPALQEALKILKLREESTPELLVVVKHSKEHAAHTIYKNADKNPFKKRDPYEQLWLFNTERECAFMGYPANLDNVELLELGPAVKKTALECKLIMRGLGWDRDRIADTEINDADPDDEIPF